MIYISFTSFIYILQIQKSIWIKYIFTWLIAILKSINFFDWFILFIYSFVSVIFSQLVCCDTDADADVDADAKVVWLL